MITVKQGDTHQIWFSVRDEVTGQPVDFTGLQAQKAFIRKQGGAVIELALAIWGAPTQGILMHQLTGTLEDGTYSLMIKLRKNDEQTTVPTEEADCLVVLPTIGNAL